MEASEPRGVALARRDHNRAPGVAPEGRSPECLSADRWSTSPQLRIPAHRKDQLPMFDFPSPGVEDRPGLNENDLLAVRAELLNGCKRILDAAEAAGARDLTRAQAADFDAARARINKINVRLGLRTLDPDRTAIQAAVADLNKPYGQPIAAKRDQPYGSAPDSEVRTYRCSEPLPASRDQADPGFYRFVRAAVTGDWQGLEEARAMSVGVDTAGGFMVPGPTASRIIDLARQQSVCLQAGALTVPMPSSTLTFARVSGDPTAYWKAENAAVTASDMTFEAVTLRAKTLMALVKTSAELWEDAVDLPGTVERALASALALELDRAILRGTGAALEPLGVRYQSGVTVTDLGTDGSYADIEDLIDAYTVIQTAHGDPSAIIWAPRTEGRFLKLKDGEGQYFERLPGPLATMPRYSTTQIPITLTHGVASTASEIYMAPWERCLVGIRTQLRVEASREAADSTNSAFASGQVWIRAYLRADAALEQPSQFVVIDGVL